MNYKGQNHHAPKYPEFVDDGCVEIQHLFSTISVNNMSQKCSIVRFIKTLKITNNCALFCFCFLRKVILVD